MSKVKKSLIIISDDFSNVLICQKGKGKNPTNLLWSTFSKDVSGRETAEKSIVKAIDKDLKCTVFNLQPYKEYSIDENNEEIVAVFTGSIKEQMTYHKEIVRTKWANKKEIEGLDFVSGEKELILEYLNSLA